MPSFYLLVQAKGEGRVDGALVTTDGVEITKLTGPTQFNVKDQATKHLRGLRDRGALSGDTHIIPRLVSDLADRSWLAAGRLEAEVSDLRAILRRVEHRVRQMPPGAPRSELLELLDPTFRLPTVPGSIITARLAGATVPEEFHLRRDGLWMSRLGVCTKEDLLSSKYSDRKVVKAA